MFFGEDLVDKKNFKTVEELKSMNWQQVKEINFLKEENVKAKQLLKIYQEKFLKFDGDLVQKKQDEIQKLESDSAVNGSHKVQEGNENEKKIKLKFFDLSKKFSS